MYNELVTKLPSEIQLDIIKKYDLSETSLVRELAQKYFESTVIDYRGTCGGNNSDTPLKCKIMDEYHLIPQNSRYT